MDIAKSLKEDSIELNMTQIFFYVNTIIMKYEFILLLLVEI